jgi:hypothetical protein
MLRFSGRNTSHGLNQTLSNNFDPITDGCRALLAAEYQRTNKKLNNYTLKFSEALYEVTMLVDQNKDNDRE